MTTLTKKKNYTTPRCVFVALEEETYLLSGSLESIDEPTTNPDTPEIITFGLQQSTYKSSNPSGSIWDTASSFE